MRQCKKCKKDIPNREKIDGIMRNISKRVYCLKCSPFGKRYNVINSPKKSAENNRTEKLVKLIKSKGGTCYKCGYDRCPQVFMFYNPKEKETISISDKLCMSLDKLIALFSLCELWCRNCCIEYLNDYNLKHDDDIVDF